MKYFENINDLNDALKINSKHPLIDIQRYEDIIHKIPLKTDPIIYGFYKIRRKMKLKKI